jgi:hypothetical protein
VLTSNVVSQILIAGIKVQKITKRIERNGKTYQYSQYFIYIPKDYEKYVIQSQWLVTVIIDDKHYETGLRTPMRRNNYYIITLPSDLAYYWEKVIFKKVDVVLQRP